MKINLILAASPFDPLKRIDPFLPLFFSILASAAPEHEYVFTDLLNQDIKDIDFDAPCDLVGISFRVSATDTAFELADIYRSKGKKVILGGPQATCIPFKAKEHADAVVIGEAELTWPQLLEDLQKNELKEFYITAPKSTFDINLFKDYQYIFRDLPDLTDIPIIKKHFYKSNYAFDMVFAARGCPINCSFCAVSKIFGTQMRLKPIANVLDEINNCGKRFFLIDDTVFGRKNTLDYYIELYEKLALLPEKRFWKGQANFDTLMLNKGKILVNLAAKSGLTYIAVGFESLNPDDLNNISHQAKMGVNDGQHFINTLTQNINFVQEHGISISAWFTMGLENDTVKNIEYAIDFCVKNHIFPVLNPIQALEGTRMYNDLFQANLLYDAKTHVSNTKISKIKDVEYIYLMKLSLKKAYNWLVIFKNTFFYFKKQMKYKQSFYERIYKTIFIFFVQLRLKSVISKEVIRFNERIHKDVI